MVYLTIIETSRSIYFMKPAFPSPSASFFGLSLSIKLGLRVSAVEEVPVVLPVVPVPVPVLVNSSMVPVLPVVPVVPVVPPVPIVPDVPMVLPVLREPVPVTSGSVTEVVPFAPAPPSVPPTAFGSPPNASVRSSRPESEPPWRSNSFMVTAGNWVAVWCLASFWWISWTGTVVCTTDGWIVSF